MKYSIIIARYSLLLFCLSSFSFFLPTLLANAQTHEQKNEKVYMTKKNKLNTHTYSEQKHNLAPKNSNKISSTSQNNSSYFYHDKERNSKNTRIIAPLQKEQHSDIHTEIQITPELYLPIKRK